MYFLKLAAFTYLILMTAVVTPLAHAGGGVHGASGLVETMTLAKEEIIPNIITQVFPTDPFFKTAPKAISEMYEKYRLTMISDIPKIEFKPTQKIIKDSIQGYKTWIGINSQGTIFYNLASYDELIGVTPEIWQITERILHEVGHFYGLNEEQSWTFARLLMRAYKAKKSLPVVAPSPTPTPIPEPLPENGVSLNRSSKRFTSTLAYDRSRGDFGCYSSWDVTHELIDQLRKECRDRKGQSFTKLSTRATCSDYTQGPETSFVNKYGQKVISGTYVREETTTATIICRPQRAPHFVDNIKSIDCTDDSGPFNTAGNCGDQSR